MLKQLAGFIAADVSGEDYRVYVYPNGDEYTVVDPETLYMKASDTDSHRVVDVDGECHYIRRGWIAIRWPAQALGF